jgi:PAS domain-containing protein
MSACRIDETQRELPPNGSDRTTVDAEPPRSTVGGVFEDSDRTRRARAEEVLPESEEHFRMLADAAPVMIWMSGVDKLCNFFNKPWLDFTGRSWNKN